jgi:hypothetical protein
MSPLDFISLDLPEPRIAALAVETDHRDDLVQRRPFSARVALRYRSRCSAAYSRRPGRVTGFSLGSEC